MLIIGLTGSIATGKSSVSSILSRAPYNIPIIDADLLARKVVEPGTTGYNQVVAHFGSTTPDLLQTPEEAGGEHGRDGKGRPLNRPALGRRVFGDSEERRRDRAILNGIIHPAVRKEMYKALLQAYMTGHWAVVLDVPLLFEAGLDRICGTVLVVAVTDPAVQIQRLRARDPHLSEEDAQNRVLSQGNVLEKAKRAEARGAGAGQVIYNDGGKDDLNKGVEKAIKEIQASSPKWWAWLLLLLPPLAGVAGVWTFFKGWLFNRRWHQQQLQERAKL